MSADGRYAISIYSIFKRNNLLACDMKFYMCNVVSAWIRFFALKDIILGHKAIMHNRVRLGSPSQKKVIWVELVMSVKKFNKIE